MKWEARWRDGAPPSVQGSDCALSLSLFFCFFCIKVDLPLVYAHVFEFVYFVFWLPLTSTSQKMRVSLTRDIKFPSGYDCLGHSLLFVLTWWTFTDRSERWNVLCLDVRKVPPGACDRNLNKTSIKNKWRGLKYGLISWLLFFFYWQTLTYGWMDIHSPTEGMCWPLHHHYKYIYGCILKKSTGCFSAIKGCWWRKSLFTRLVCALILDSSSGKH